MKTVNICLSYQRRLGVPSGSSREIFLVICEDVRNEKNFNSSVFIYRAGINYLLIRFYSLDTSLRWCDKLCRSSFSQNFGYYNLNALFSVFSDTGINGRPAVRVIFIRQQPDCKFGSQLNNFLIFPVIRFMVQQLDIELSLKLNKIFIFQ